MFEVEDNKLTSLKFINGCSGNLQAISKLTLGMDIDEIISRFSGIKCKSNTSCPDQLAIALVEYKERMKKKEESL
jgi:uncharacterized protein (TIGR03905 family)